MLYKFTIIYAIASLAISCCLYTSFRYDQRHSGTWGCEMSWMTPSYRLIQEGRYSLYLYREQGWDLDEEVCCRFDKLY